MLLIQKQNKELLMARKVCTAGVVGLYSYLIMDTGNEAISMIKDRVSEEEKVVGHPDMQYAEQWTDKQLITLNGLRYETD